MKLRHVAGLITERGDGSELPYVALEHVEGNTGRLVDAELPVTAASNATVIFKPGDVLYGKLRPYLNKVFQTSFDGAASTELLTMRASDGVEPRFLYYSIASRPFLAWGDASSYGVKMPRTSWELVRQHELQIPDLINQMRVADFLDRETARIDALVEKKRRLIDLLEEKRTALITEAVTKGLDASVPTKDSGVPWLGEIPEHWEATSLKRMAQNIQTGPFGSQVHNSDYVAGGVPLINPTNIKDGRIVIDSEMAVSEGKAIELDRHLLEVGDIVLGRRGEMGRCAVVDRHGGGSLCGTGSMRIRLDESIADPSYYGALISSHRVRDQFLLHSVGSTMDNLSASVVREVSVPKPPLPEQRAITRTLSSMRQAHQLLHSRLEDQIDLLAEYREALITAAVTGELDLLWFDGERAVEAVAP